MNELGYPHPAPLAAVRRRRRGPFLLGGAILFGIGLAVALFLILGGRSPQPVATTPEGGGGLAEGLGDVAIEALETDASGQIVRAVFTVPAALLHRGDRLTVARPDGEASRYVTIAEVERVEVVAADGDGAPRERIWARSDAKREEMEMAVGDRVRYLWADPDRPDRGPQGGLTLDALRGPGR